MTNISTFSKILNHSSEHIYFVLIVVGLLTSAFCYLVLHAKSKPLSPPLPPGPWSLPVIVNLLFFEADLHTYFLVLAKKHGPIFKLWLGAKLTIIVTSSEVAHEILRTNDVIFANHDVPAVGPVNTYGGNEILWSPYGPKWRMLKKLCVNKVLSNTMLDSSCELRRQETRRKVAYLAEKARAGSPVDFGEQTTCMILNVVMQMLWGTAVKEEEREIVGAKFFELVAEMNDLLIKPNISDFFPVLTRFDIQGLVKRMGVLAQKMDHMFDQIISQRLGIVRESDGRGGDFLDVLLKIKDAKDEKTNLTMNDVKALLVDMVLGGTDTSLHVMEFTMAELLNNPDVMKRAREELDKVVGKDKVVEESHIPKLPYILAVMKETLRLHTIAPLLAPHSPSEDTVVDGFTIPKNSKVLINAWAIHRNPNVWKNPLEFNPDRFLGKSYDFNGNDFNYIPFGSGRRICMGVDMSKRLVLYNLATLLHSFDWKLAQGERLEIEEKFGIVLKMKNPVFVTPVIRLSDPNLYL
ncbi:unnamed protein product [Cochlearia groenlandica]